MIRLQLTNCDDGALSPGFRLWLSSLAGLRASQLAICVMSFPSTARLFGSCCDFQVSDVTDTCKCFSAETIGADRGEVFKSLQLRGCETLTQDWQIFFLLAISQELSKR